MTSRWPRSLGMTSPQVTVTFKILKKSFLLFFMLFWQFHIFWALFFNFHFSQSDGHFEMTSRWPCHYKWPSLLCDVTSKNFENFSLHFFAFLAVSHHLDIIFQFSFFQKWRSLWSDEQMAMSLGVTITSKVTVTFERMTVTS